LLERLALALDARRFIHSRTDDGEIKLSRGADISVHQFADAHTDPGEMGPETNTRDLKMYPALSTWVPIRHAWLVFVQQ